ncbi:MAG: carboxypeptidase-like regulatory domain-containing protein [Pyrinomonadaceae bacterium]
MNTVAVTVAALKVSEVFRGIGGNEVDLWGANTTCDFPFEQNKTYVVFAYRDEDGKWSTGVCSHTAELGEAHEDLAYLRLTRNEKGGALTGTVDRTIYGKANLPTDLPIERATVYLVSSSARFQATTDRHGSYVVRNVPEGKYRVYTEPRTNMSNADDIDAAPTEEWIVDIPGHGCKEVWFSARPAGSLSGRIVDANGDAVKSATVELIPAGVKLTEDNVWSRSVNANGDYQFNYLPAGRYFVGLNLSNGPSRSAPYPATYYPGVKRKELATVVEIGQDQRLTGYNLMVPADVSLRTVTGIARWPDGRPAVNISIQLDNPANGYREGDPVTTDMNGRFSIQGMEGQTYKLSALIHDGQPLVNSIPLIVKIEAENIPVELVIRLPNK